MKGFFFGFLVICFLSSFCLANISLKLNGGLAYISGGDWSTAIDSMNAYIAAQPSHSGGYKKLGVGMNFGGEVIYHFDKHIGVGLGCGYFQMSATSGYNYSDKSGQSFVDSSFDEMRIILIVLNIHYLTPVTGSLNFTASLGCGYYLGKFSTKDTWDNLLSYLHSTGTGKFSASKDAFGFQGAIGIEYALGKAFFMTLDVRGRFASLGNLDGELNSEGTKDSIPFHTQEKGYSVWYYESPWQGKLYRLISVTKDAPIGTNVHKADIALTGFAVAIGVRIKL